MKAGSKITTGQFHAAAVAVVAGLVLMALPSGAPVAAEKAAVRGSLDAAMGKGLFKRNWVPAPSSTKSNDGLGPLFNARSCQQCHAAATAGKIETGAHGTLAERGAVVRLGDDTGAPDPAYGAQVQTRAVQNQASEANVHITWEERQVALADGTQVGLRRPTVTLQGSHGALSPQSASALVLAPSLAAAAQIQRVDVQALSQQAAVAGRLSRDAQGQVLVFGRKASHLDLTHAVEMAFARDLGMSTRGLPNPAGDCTVLQQACLEGPHGGDEAGIEIAPEIVAALVAYVASLAPRERAPADAGGAALFEATGCAACHRATLPGKDGQPVALYSDLRLHDLGADLAGIPDVQGQTAAEWRTAPLLGLQKRLAAGSTLLHDGRARSVEEAILWHGGQAQSGRDAYARLTAAQRRALQNFVLSR